MKVPYCRYAYVPKEKIEMYLISSTHVVGKHKSRVFRSRGFNESNVDLLEKEFLNIIYTCEVVHVRLNQWGKGYDIVGFIRTPDGGSMQVKIGWFINIGKRSPRLTSVVPV